MESDWARRVRMEVQRVWQEVWKRAIREDEVERGEGRGWGGLVGSPMLKALLSDY